MIDRDYDKFKTDKNFNKEVRRIVKNTTINDNPEKEIFRGSSSFPENFISGLETYADMQIEVEEYACTYMQYLRMKDKYAKADFFNSLCPLTNETKLRKAFDKTAGMGGYPLFSTADKKFIIKQISENEKNMLLNVFLVPYCQHVLKNTSFICRMLGLFGIQIK
jgi:hypothetical protein